MGQIAAALALVLLLPSSSPGQATPEAAAGSMALAIRTGDYAGAARLMHPAALRQLRDIFTPQVLASDGADIAQRLFGLQSPSSFASTPDTVLYANFMRAFVSQEAGLGEVLRNADIQIIGHVTGSADTAFVVSRMTLTVEGITVTTYEVMPFILLGSKYRGLLLADFTNLAAMLSRRQEP